MNLSFHRNAGQILPGNTCLMSSKQLTAADSFTWHSIKAVDKQVGESPPKLGASGSVQTRVNLCLSVTLKSTFLGNQRGDPLSSRTWEKSSQKLGGKLSNGIFQFCPSFWLKGRLCKRQDGDIKMEGLVNSPCYLDSWYLRSRNSLGVTRKGPYDSMTSLYLLCSPLGGQFHLHELQSQRKPVLLVPDITLDI